MALKRQNDDKEPVREENEQISQAALGVSPEAKRKKTDVDEILDVNAQRSVVSIDANVDNVSETSISLCDPVPLDTSTPKPGTSSESVVEKAQLLTPEFIEQKLIQIYNDNRGRMRRSQNGEVFNPEWRIILTCFINLLSDEKFKPTEWKNLFSKCSTNKPKKGDDGKTLFTMMDEYEKLAEKDVTIESKSAKENKTSRNNRLRENYVKPFYDLFNGAMKDIFCAIFVKLFDSLPNKFGIMKISPSNIQRAVILGDEIVQGYIGFQQSPYYEREIWRFKIALPRELRQRFILASALETDLVGLPDESDKEEEIPTESTNQPTAFISTRVFVDNNKPHMKMVNQQKKCGVNDFLNLRKQQLETAKNELVNLHLLVAEKETKVKKLEADIEKYSKLAQQETTNSKIFELLEVEKNEKRRLLVAEIVSKLFKNYSVEELKLFEAQTPLVDLSTFADTLPPASSANENEENLNDPANCENDEDRESNDHEIVVPLNDADAVTTFVPGAKTVSKPETATREENNGKDVAVDKSQMNDESKLGQNNDDDNVEQGKRQEDTVSGIIGGSFSDEEDDVDQDQVNRINTERVDYDFN